MPHAILNFEKPRIITLIGSPGLGKSHMIKNIIYHLGKSKRVAFGVVWTGSIVNDDFDFMPEGSVRDDYSDDNLQAYMNKLKNWRMQNKGKNLPPNILVLDDMIGIMRGHSAVFSNLMSIHRHYNMTVLISSQYISKNISTMMRSMTNYSFIFHTHFMNSMKHLYDSYGQVCESYEEFISLLNRATEQPHWCLLYNAQERSKEKAYIAYKAPPVKDFKLKFKPV